MRASREAASGWERVLTRYFAATGIPLRWEYGRRRFEGISGHLFARLNPAREEALWANIPKFVRKYESDDTNPSSLPVIIFVTNRRYGDSVEDSLVVMRLGAFAPMLKSFVDSDKERWVE